MASGNGADQLRFAAAEADRDFAAQAQPNPASTGAQSKEIPAPALLAQLVEHFHGKEGVNGSSPLEGLCGSPVVVGRWG